MVICLFNIFNGMKFKSRFVNYIFSLSLFFYCIHENLIVRGDIRLKVITFFTNIFGETDMMYALAYMFLTLGLFVGATVAAAVYKKLFAGIVDKAGCFLTEKLKLFCSKEHLRVH